MNDHWGDPQGKARPDTVACHARAVQRVMATMRDRLDEELSLHEMADVAIMSKFHFNRTFHHVTGIPPGRFLGALRLERARQLLLTTQKRVTDVCFDVGYNSLGTFTRRFTEVLGVSPRGLRSYAAAGSPAIGPPARVLRREKSGEGQSVSGTVVAPPEFTGLVFVGLFRTAVPHGAPAACRVLTGSGPFSLRAPAGRYHVYALGVRTPADPLSLLMFDDALRAAAGTIDVSATMTPAPVHLSLRPRSEFDPPILLTLPLLLARRAVPATHSRHGPSSEAVA